MCSSIYAAATEANSNLNAALKNIQLVINYVSGIKLPYIKDTDIEKASELLKEGLTSKSTDKDFVAAVRDTFEDMRQKSVQLESWMKRVRLFHHLVIHSKN